MLVKMLMDFGVALVLPVQQLSTMKTNEITYLYFIHGFYSDCHTVNTPPVESLDTPAFLYT